MARHLLAILVAVVALTNSVAAAQPAPTQPPSQQSPSPTAVPTELPKLPIGRFVVTATEETVIMVDTITGNTWVLNREGDDTAAWVGVPRFDNHEAFVDWREYREETRERDEMIERLTETLDDLEERHEQMLDIAKDENKAALNKRFDAQVTRLRRRIVQLEEESFEADEEFFRESSGEQEGGDEAAVADEDDVDDESNEGEDADVDEEDEVTIDVDAAVGDE